jgi:glycosyltransferase involved in cell wall biosynthesis
VDERRALHVLVVTAAYPTTAQPHSGTFIKSQVDSLRSVEVESTVLHISGRPVWKYLTAAWRVFLLARSGNYDLVHAHYGYCGIVARAQWGVPVVVSFCGDDLLGTPDQQGRRPIMRKLEILSNLVLALVVDGIIVKSRGMLRVLWPPPRVPAAVIPNGVDLDLFRPGSRTAARARLGLDLTRRYAVFPADPSNPQKGYAVAVEAVAQLRAEGLDIELQPVCGRPQTEVVDFYNAADVVVLPSFSEGSPNVVKEAMACNAPVVVTDVGDVHEVLGDTNGCFVVERTSRAFAGAIRRAIGLSGGRTSGRERMAPLSIELVARQVRAMYDTVLARSGRYLGRERVVEAA